MIHNKSLAVKFGFRGIVELEAGLDHWAQWGGVSSTLGDRPESFKDFIRVTVGGNGGDDATKSDQLNALGNHLGREYVRLNWNASLFKLKLQYDMLSMMERISFRLRPFRMEYGRLIFHLIRGMV